MHISYLTSPFQLGVSCIFATGLHLLLICVLSVTADGPVLGSVWFTAEIDLAHIEVWVGETLGSGSRVSFGNHSGLDGPVCFLCNKLKGHHFFVCSLHYQSDQSGHEPCPRGTSPQSG